MIKVSDVIHIKGMDEKKRESLYELSKDKYVKAFLKEYHLPESSLNDYWIEFLDYRDDRKLCENCTGLKQCSKENKGIVKELEFIDNDISLSMMNCDFYLKSQDVLNHFVLKHGIKDDLLLTNLETLISKKQISQKGQSAFVEIMKYIKEPTKKGLFFHSENSNNEKTILMAALMNALAKKGNTIGFVHFPTYLADLKASFQSEEKRINWSDLMDLPYLVLDSIGEESVTSYSRDEVLSTILSYRALNGLPTFFTSFYGFKDLQKVYTTKKGDEIKAKTVILKIKSLTKEVILD